MSEIPDPVFAEGLVGPGLAVCPEKVPQTAVAPVSGVLAKLHPHAFLVVSDSGNGVLVHLGIDTVHLHGQGFELLARQGERVEAGDAVVAWDPRAVEEAGRSAVCAVVVLDCDPADVRRQQLHVDVGSGELLFEVDC